VRLSVRLGALSRSHFLINFIKIGTDVKTSLVKTSSLGSTLRHPSLFCSPPQTTILGKRSWKIHANHRLHKSASPVLTATHHSNGRFWEFLIFSRDTPGGQTPQPIVTQNGLNDADSVKDMPFGVKTETFCTTWPLGPEKHQNLANFGLDLHIFRSISL